MKVIGIDPGKNGGCVILSTECEKAYYHQFNFDKQAQLELSWFRDFATKINKEDLIMLEKPHVVHKSSVTSMFNMGHVCGQINMAVRLIQCKYRLVDPKGWQKIIHEGTNTNLTAKERTMLAYTQFYPKNPLCPDPRYKKDGTLAKIQPKVSPDLVDALMIATFGIMKYSKVGLKNWQFEEIP